MKLKFILSLLLFVGLQGSCQNILFTVAGEPVYSEDFIAVYNKNRSIINSSEENSLASYLDLYVNYKLKVKAARNLGLDTLETFKEELQQYKNQLIIPYLKDEKVKNKLIEEAYQRLRKEINASHILIFLKPNFTEEDSINAYNKLLEAKDLIETGEDFSIVAKKYSQDQSVEKNGGELGYFTAFQMVYPFEEVAFTTSKNEVSLPFRTQFGLHILRVNDIRDSKGSVEVAHIMLRNGAEGAEKRIDSIYQQVVTNKMSFDIAAKTYSDDKSSAINGGRLKKFSSGQMLDSFSEVAFSLNEKEEISKPFETPYGWHIIKLIEKFPVLGFEEVKVDIKKRVESDLRSKLITQSVVDSLRRTYTIVMNDLAFNQFQKEDWRLNTDFEKELFAINQKKIYQKDFIKFLNSRNKGNIKAEFKEFQDQEILTYFKNNIERTNKDFALICKEFEEGLLLFEILDKKIWKQSKDSIGLANFYDSNKELKYTGKKFEDYKGVIISDYQKHLEDLWIEELHQIYEVEFNRKERKKILEAKLD